MLRMSHGWRRGCVGLVAFASLAVAQATDWPQFRFDDAHTGFNPFETRLSPSNVDRLQLRWAAQLGDLVVASSPAVAMGVVYIGSSEGRLWAYPVQGCGRSVLCTRPLWKSSPLAQILSSPTVVDGIVYVGSQTSPRSNDGRLNAFAAGGCGAPVCRPLWQGLAGRQSILESSPAVANGVVYVGAFDGRLYAFAAGGCGAPTCAPLWTGQTGGSIESSPTVVDGVVYIGSDDGRLYAFDAAGCGAARCAPLWSGGLGSAVFQSTPTVAGGVVYIGSQHALSAFAAAGCGAASCAPLWQAVDDEQFFNGSPALAGGRVVIGLENGLAVYDAAGCGAARCAPLWKLFGTGFQAAVTSSPAIANGVVYAGRNTGQVLAWALAPCGRALCNELWSATVNEPLVSSSPAVVDGRLYIGSADNLAGGGQQGRLYVFGL